MSHSRCLPRAGTQQGALPWVSFSAPGVARLGGELSLALGFVVSSPSPWMGCILQLVVVRGCELIEALRAPVR